MNTNQEKQNINQMLNYGRIIFILVNIRSGKRVFVTKPDFYLMFNTLLKSNEVGIEPSSPGECAKLKQNHWNRMQYNNLHLNYPFLIIDEDRIVNHSKTPLVAQPYCQ